MINILVQLSVALEKLAVLAGVLGVALASPAEYVITPLQPSDSVVAIQGQKSVENATSVNLGAKDGITEDNVLSVVDSLIRCESGGRRGAINPKDVDGRPKYGELQYDLRTWAWFEELFEFKGDPMIRKDAIHMTRLALLNGYANHWGCFQKLGL